MRPIQIRIELLRQGYSNRRVAAGLRLSERTVHNVIYGHGKSQKVAREIARITGLDIETLWPGKYHYERKVA